MKRIIILSCLLVCSLLLLSFSGCENALQKSIQDDVGAEITIKLGSELITNEEGVCDFGNVDINASEELEITIENSGHADLQLTGESLISFEGTDSGRFQVTTLPDATIKAGSSSTFTLSFDPSSTGLKSALAVIKNNSNLSIYTFSLTGNGVASEIQVGV